MAASAVETFAKLESNRSLEVFELVKTVTDRGESKSAQNRSSDASTHDDYAPTLESLTADSEHYKELYSKLKFSYLEQVTKERFLRAVTADPPLFVEPADNAALEEHLAAESNTLRTQKADYAALTAEVEAKAVNIVQRFETLQSQKETLNKLPEELDNLEATVAPMRQSYPSPEKSKPKFLRLPLSDTLALLNARRAEYEGRKFELEALQKDKLPNAQAALKRAREETKDLEERKKVALSRATEARERMEKGRADERENVGRWLRAGGVLMEELLGAAGNEQRNVTTQAEN